MRKVIKIFDGMLALCMICVFTFIFLGNAVLPDRINNVQNENINLLQIYSVHRTDSDNSADVMLSSGKSVSNNATIKLFGVIPVKRTTVSAAKRQYVIPGGDSFGIKLYTDGVIVVGLNDVETKNGAKNPAEDAGIKVGDVIVEIGGKKVTSTESVNEALNNADGKPITIRFKRNDEYKTAVVAPVVSSTNGSYKTGMWVRDSTAGVGTVTFYNPNNKTFGGLGHPVNDVDTNEIMPLLSGEAVKARVTGVYKGKSGETGSLCCAFDNETIGKLKSNGSNGIYGTYTKVLNNDDAIPVAVCQEVKKGPAKILSTVDGEGVKEYSIEIERINYNSSSGEKNMVIKITDQNLLSKTGGIVQGMSGSPIIQNGMLVGAVTHVFINNPTKGYAIFAENMLETSSQVR